MFNVKRSVVLVALLVVSCVPPIAAQWGGTFINRDGNRGTDGPNMGADFGGNMNNNAGPNARSSDSGGSNQQQQQQQRPPQSGPGSQNPMPGQEEEFKDKWMPTAQAGFKMPEQIKKMMDASKEAKPSTRAEFRGNSGFQNKMNPKSGSGESEEDDDDEEESAEESHFPKTAPGRKQQQSKQMDKCLKKVAHFCSLRTMNENFAMFADCVYSMRYRVGTECTPWAEGHGPCAPDLVVHCSNMSPADATECLKKNKSKLSRTCVDSQFYISMEEGFKEFREGMQEGMKGSPRGPPRYHGPQTNEDDENLKPSKPPKREAERQDPERPEADIVRLRPRGIASEAWGDEL